ncbi:MAG: methyltransferase domain-containing protein [Deltaproteobacteria bacterium]|nr:MAG: methyltransferase domain-containing protein [Deltaproteobacteria bacterium]
MPSRRFTVHPCSDPPVPQVTIGPLPDWMPVERLLGAGGWHVSVTPEGTRSATAELSRTEAADVAARLRGLGFAGHAIHVDVRPKLSRPQVRAGRLREARARRDTSPGFTRRGARLDELGKRFLTPEALALAIGQRAAGRSVLDLTAGAGGNAIGFARAGCPVTAVEIDADRLALAQHNARIYQVADRIQWRRADALDVVQTASADLVFVDPPWGGYDKLRSTLSDLPLLSKLLPHLVRHREIWLKLPPSFDPSTLNDGAEIEPMFGVARGDENRVKLLLARLTPG